MTSSYYLLQDLLLASVYSHATCLMLDGVPHVAATKGTIVGLFAAQSASGNTSSSSSSSMPADRIVPLWEEDMGIAAVGIIAACNDSICLLTDDGCVAVVTFDTGAKRTTLRFHTKLICHDGDGAIEPSRSFQPILRSNDAGTVILMHAFEGFLHMVHVKLILASRMSVPFAGAVQYHRLEKSYALSSVALLPRMGTDCAHTYIPLTSHDPTKVINATKGVIRRYQLYVGVSRGSDLSTLSVRTVGAPTFATGGSRGNVLGDFVIEGVIVTTEVVHVYLPGNAWKVFAHTAPSVRGAFVHLDPASSTEAPLPAITLLGGDGHLYQVLLHNQSDDCERSCSIVQPTYATSSEAPSSFVPNPHDSSAMMGRWVAGVDLETGAVGLLDVMTNTILTSMRESPNSGDIEARQHVCSAVDAGLVAGRGCYGSITDVAIEPPRMAVTALKMAAHTHATGELHPKGEDKYNSWWTGWQQVSEHGLHEPSTLAVSTSNRYVRRVASLLNTDTVCTIDAAASRLVSTVAGEEPSPVRVVLSSQKGSKSLDVGEGRALPPIDPTANTLASWVDVSESLSLQVSSRLVKWVGGGETLYTAAINCTQASVSSCTCSTSGTTTVLIALGSEEGVRTLSFTVGMGTVATLGCAHPTTMMGGVSVSALTVLRPFVDSSVFIVVFSLWGEGGAVRMANVQGGFMCGSGVSNPMECPLFNGCTVSSMWSWLGSHLLLQTAGGAVFAMLCMFEEEERGCDAKVVLKGTTTQLLRDDVLPGCVSTLQVTSEVLIAMALASGPIVVVGVPKQLLGKDAAGRKSLCARFGSDTHLGPISCRLFSHSLLPSSSALTAIEFLGVFEQVGAPLSVQLVLASSSKTIVVELRGTFRFHVLSQTQISPSCVRRSKSNPPTGGSILRVLPLLPPAYHSVTDADTGRCVASLVALVEAPQSTERELPTYTITLLSPNHSSVGEYVLPQGLLASSMTPGLPSGGSSASLPPDPNLAETPASEKDSAAMFGLRGDVGKSSVLSYVTVVGGCRADDGAGFLLPFLTNPFRCLCRDPVSGNLSQSSLVEDAFYISLPAPVNDLCTLSIEGRPAVAAATHTEIVLCFTDTLPSSFSVFKSLTIDSPCLSIRCTANVIAAHSSGLITYYEFQTGALREKAVEITPFTVLTGMGGVDGYMVKADAQRNLTMSILEDRPNNKGGNSATANPTTDRYSLPAKMGTRMGGMGLRVVPVGQMCEASVAVPTTFTFFSTSSDPSLTPNHYNRPCRLFNHMLLSPSRSAAKQVFNFNEPFECYFSLQPLSQRFLVCGQDGSLQCLTRIPNEASRIIQRLGTCIDNYNDNMRVELREPVEEDGSRLPHSGITTVPHYKARRVVLDTRTVPESFTLHLRTIQQFATLPHDVRAKVVATFIQSENSSPVSAGSLLELIIACRGLC